jgi:hypothetical protein
LIRGLQYETYLFGSTTVKCCENHEPMRHFLPPTPQHQLMLHVAEVCSVDCEDQPKYLVTNDTFTRHPPLHHRHPWTRPP